MAVCQPDVNEYQRALHRAAQSKARFEALSHHIFRPLPTYRLTPLTEWSACLYAKTGEIKAKSLSGLVTYYSSHPTLDWEWLQRVKPDWVCCPQCGRAFPKDARYWWWRNKPKGYLYLDACRDCKCKTAERWSERKRARNSRAH